MPSKSANVKNEKQYEALKDKGMSKERAAKIANSPDASKHGGEKSHPGPARATKVAPRAAQSGRPEGWESCRCPEEVGSRIAQCTLDVGGLRGAIARLDTRPR